MKVKSWALSCAAAALITTGVSACSVGGPPLPKGDLGTGPYTFGQTVVTGGGGYGGGTIYTPTAGPTAGPYPGVVVVPGFSQTQASIAWYGPLLASQGFVVFAIDTNSTSDNPDSRSQQQEAAMKYLTGSSAVKAKVDASRMGAAGWSMGGGGSLRLGLRMPSLKAIFSLAGWEPSLDVSGLRVPALMVACQNDAIAGNSGNSQRFYDSISVKKVYNEVPGDHFCVTKPSQAVANVVVPWAKIYLAGDTSYSKYLCPGPAVSAAVTKYQASCPIP